MSTDDFSTGSIATSAYQISSNVDFSLFDLSSKISGMQQGLLSDEEIKNICDFITPFAPSIIRQIEGRKVFSYGLGSYGYDVRLSPDKFYQIRNPAETWKGLKQSEPVVDPKNFDSSLYLEELPLIVDDQQEYFVMPPHSYCLGLVEEKLNMPKDVTGFGFPKSSYTRIGITTFITPIESAWSGHLTIGMANLSPNYTRVYANEGIAQLVFTRSSICGTSYQDRAGKYQNQGKEITTTKV